jgi:hypothetical protein
MMTAKINAARVPLGPSRPPHSGRGRRSLPKPNPTAPLIPCEVLTRSEIEFALRRPVGQLTPHRPSDEKPGAVGVLGIADGDQALRPSDLNAILTATGASARFAPLKANGRVINRHKGRNYSLARFSINERERSSDRATSAMRAKLSEVEFTLRGPAKQLPPRGARDHELGPLWVLGVTDGDHVHQVGNLDTVAAGRGASARLTPADQ